VFKEGADRLREHKRLTMWNTASVISSALLALCLAGCAGMRGEPIMQTAPGDPVGSANIGTGSVSTNSTIPPEAKAAGMGLGP
jgi:hypothetical protein